jgi:hypothetical protein
VGYVALFFALGGGVGWASQQALPKNSVGTKQLKKGAVTAAKLHTGAVNASNVANNSLTGRQINAATLGTVPNAIHAGTADSATNAGQLGGSPASAYVKGPAEAFHEVTAFGSCNGVQSWVNFNSSVNSTAAYYRDPLGVVHLKGTVSCSTAPGIGSPIFGLPAGYAPAKDENFSAPSAGGATVILVRADGSVKWPGGTSPGAGGFLDLDGISFRCEPSGANGCP